jgi:hypothetical protein
MNPHLITVYLPIETNEHLQSQVAEALQGVLTDGMRTSAGTDSVSTDWAIADDDIPSSIARVPLLDEYAADRTVFPHWLRRAF